MNLKKFISGVSALTIAASAFAGMAVTASAAELNGTLANYASQYSTGSKRSWAYTINGTTADNVIPFGQSRGDSSSAGIAYIQYTLPDMGEDLFDSAALDIYVTISTSGGDRSISLYKQTDEDFDITAISDDASHWDTTSTVIKDVTTEELGSQTIARYTNTDGGYKLSYDVSDAISAAYTANETSITFAVMTGAALQGTVGVSGDIAPALTVETKEAGAADDIAVSYKAGDVEVAADIIDVGEGYKDGDSYTFYLPAYVEDANAIYTTDITSFAKTVTLSEGTTTVDIPVTLVTNGVYQFNEPAGTAKQYNNRESQTSNGTIQSVGSTGVDILTVAEDGVYSIKLVSASTEGTSRNGALYKNSVDDANKIGDVAFAGNVTIYNFTDVELKANDKLVLKGSNSKSSYDYVLIQKTGEISVDTSAALSDMVTESVTGTDNSVAVIAKGTVTGVNTVDTLTITVGDEIKTKTNGTDFTFDTDLGGSEVELAIIVLGVSSVNSISIN